MDEPAFHNEVIAWYFKIEFRTYRTHIGQFDSRTTVGEIDNRSWQPLAVTKDDHR